MQQQIKAYYQATFADKQNIQVSDPMRIADGWETEIFSFEIDYFLNGEPIHENIIMRMFPSNDAYEKSAKEFSVMRQLYAVGYPVPQVYHLEQENSTWGKPFILMERIEGGIMWPQLVGYPVPVPFKNDMSALSTRGKDRILTKFQNLIKSFSNLS